MSLTLLTPVTVGLLRANLPAIGCRSGLPNSRGGPGGRSIAHQADLLTRLAGVVESDAIVRIVATSTADFTPESALTIDGGSAMHQSNRLWRRGGVALVVAAMALTLGACAS